MLLCIDCLEKYSMDMKTSYIVILYRIHLQHIKKDITSLLQHFN